MPGVGPRIARVVLALRGVLRPRRRGIGRVGLFVSALLTLRVLRPLWVLGVLWALGVLGRRLVVAEQAVEEVLVQPGCIEGRAPAAVGRASLAAVRMSSRVTSARPSHAAWATAARAVTMSARIPSTSKPAHTVAILSSAQSLRRTRPKPSCATAIRAAKSTCAAAYDAWKPAGSASKANRRRTTSARCAGSRLARTSTVRPKRSSNWGRSSPSSGFMVPIRTMRAGCETETPSRSTVLRPMAAASRSRSTRWSWRRLTSST